MITYDSKDDVWEMIRDLYAESKEIKSDDSYDPLVDVFNQLPYFCCPNIILDNEIQKDIQRYMYCSDTGTPPYPGNYGDVPSKWMNIHFVLRNAIAVSQNEERKKYQRKLKAQSKQGIKGR